MPCYKSEDVENKLVDRITNEAVLNNIKKKKTLCKNLMILSKI